MYYYQNKRDSKRTEVTLNVKSQPGCKQTQFLNDIVRLPGFKLFEFCN